jgi:hypothetical protein
VHVVGRPVCRTDDEVAILQRAGAAGERREADDRGLRRQAIDVDRSLEIREDRRTSVTASGGVAMTEGPNSDIVATLA